MMDVGQVKEHHQADQRWSPTVDGAQLHFREGFRARYTFGPRVQVLGGLTFEWWLEELNAPAELAHHGGPLWVARAVTGKETTAAIFARADQSARIIGRAIGASGVATGSSTPAQLVRAIERHCGAPVGRLKAALTVVGLTHPKVKTLLALVRPEAEPRSANNVIGTHAGGLSKLTQGGSQLRKIRRLAGEAFEQAMESVSPGEPQLVFAELMKSPSFRNTYLPTEWKDGLTPAAIRHQMMETPFIAGMVNVYTELKGWKAKRQHLALFAPYFPVKECSLASPLDSPHSPSLTTPSHPIPIPTPPHP